MFAELFQFYNLAKDTFKSEDIQLFKHKNLKSISSYSSGTIFYFPMIISDQCSLEEIKLISRSLEKQYAAFVAACISLVPFHRVEEGDVMSIEKYLQTFHQNIGITGGSDIGNVIRDVAAFTESTQITEADVDVAMNKAREYWVKSMNENSSFVELSLAHIKSINESTRIDDHLDSFSRVLLNRTRTNLNEAKDIDFGTPGDDSMGTHHDGVYQDLPLNKTFPDKEIFSSSDMKKANELIPTFIKATVGFIVGSEERVVKKEILVGIKTYIHKYQSKILIEDIYQTIKNGRKFLQFVKFVTGEENSLADLVLGIDKIKYDVMTAKKAGVSDQQIAMIKKRSRFAKMQIPYIMKNYMPNASYVITSNEVSLLKSIYNIDILSNGAVPRIMADNFLLGFVILDQTNESAYISYEGHNYQFQEIPYTYLEREATESDRMTRQLYRDFMGRR